MCRNVSKQVIQAFITSISSHHRNIKYLKFLKVIVKPEGQLMNHIQNMIMDSLSTISDDVLQFYNEATSFLRLIDIMSTIPDEILDNRDEAIDNELIYHLELVELLSICTEGQNMHTELKCQSLLPIDDAVKVSYYLLFILIFFLHITIILFVIIYIPPLLLTILSTRFNFFFPFLSPPFLLFYYKKGACFPI